MKPILVTSYVSPDLDGLSCAVAYAELLQKSGKDAAVEIIGDIHVETKYVLDRFKIGCPKSISDSSNYDRIVLVDASDLDGLAGKIDVTKVIEIIDHRKVNEADKFPNAKAQIELVGAAATLVAERFMKSDIQISVESATLLCSAIISNTLNFKGSVTTDRDKKAALWLNSVAKLPDGFWKDLFESKSDLSGEKLPERLIGDFASFDICGKKLGIAQLEIMKAEELVEKRPGEITQTLAKIKNEKRLDIVFTNVIDLEQAQNFFVASDLDAQELLTGVFSVEFVDDVAKRPNLIMRKQIVAILKDHMERK